ncbi:hypothetical protein NPIL_555371 [Nephila pilipes]|uniref:C2H2-type domain-containing protein n=1 Tax=Nephila pilipes TaxID=299642 RepID=A0A8X6P6Q8_NEPPI|nr:hypothetical protein NPIL_555371 [Nephila pilipes]
MSIVLQNESCKKSSSSVDGKESERFDLGMKVERRGRERIASAVSNIYSMNMRHIINQRPTLLFEEQNMLLQVRKEKALFQCIECNKSYPFKSLLQRHMVVHTGEKPYSCHICLSCFKYQGALYNHLRVHDRMNQTT